jgi:predicted Zn-dependent protease
MAKILSFLLKTCFLFFLVSCATVPVTGRQQLSLVPAQQLMSMSFQSYDEFLKKNKFSADAEKSQLVRRTGKAVQQAVERYMRMIGRTTELDGYQWEFNLVEDESVNAWCMPGGKVVVYTGILPVAKDETGLAVIMGHEIAHAIANHGGERLSHGLVVQMGGIALSEALSTKAPQTRQIFLSLYDVGSQVGYVLPYSRLQESEADRMGLIFMAMAGYDPGQAIPFWQRMANQKDGKNTPPEFLSTHPSDETRIKEIKSMLPEAMQYYKKN